MELGSIPHRSAYSDCYAISENEIVVNLRAGKEVTAVFLIHNDPFAGGVTGFKAWDGNEEAMNLRWELKYHNICSITLRRKFPQLRRGRVLWKHDPAYPRLLCIRRHCIGGEAGITPAFTCKTGRNMVPFS